MRLLKAIPRGTFSTVGGALLGAPGAAIGRGISTLTGIGDYTLNDNGFLGGSVDATGQVPVLDNVIGKKTVRHKEFVINIKAPDSPGDFKITTYAINPASSSLFPWLNGIAKHYQRYKIRAMVFGYETASTDYANSGTVALAVQYDPEAPDFQTMGGILNSQFASASKPSVSFAVPVECNKYATNGGMLIVDDENSRLTSFGKITIATEGLQVAAGTVIGRLHVSYEIDFSMTQAQVERLGGGGNTNTAFFNSFTNNAMSWTANGGLVAPTVPGSVSQFVNLLTAPTNNSEILISSNEVNNQWALRPRLLFTTGGRYLVAYYVYARNSDAVIWENGLSTAGETTGEIVALKHVEVIDYTSTTASQGGMYIVFYIVTAQPNSTLAPSSASRELGSTGAISARLTITKLT